MENISQGPWFTCNICGSKNELLGAVQHRELMHCDNCHSCARFRGIAKAINNHLLFRSPSAPLAGTAERKDIKGIGMSDAECYSNYLESIFSYTNTYYHTDPLLDISSSESASRYCDLDFVISSDVLEHVRSPVSAALINIGSMLKKGGKLILSVPYLEGYETIEHFPHLNDFGIVQLGDTYVMVNKRVDGLIEIHQNLSFHGGPGSVLEMRIFGEGDLLALLTSAGFGSIDVLRPDDEEIGYFWQDHVESVLAGGRRSKSYIVVCTKSA